MNELQTTQKLVAFIDILGFSKIIEQYDAGKLPNVLKKLNTAIDPAVGLIKNGHPTQVDSPFFRWKDCLDARLFSDCLCAAAPLEYKTYGLIEQFKFFYKYITGYQIVLMEKGFFARGAVTIGSHYADNNMIFSGGLVEAYNLETKKAIYPRIIVSENLLAQLYKLASVHSEDLNYMLARGNDGVCFLNHFNYNLIDSNLMGKMALEALETIKIPGMIDINFVELDEVDKKETLQRIKTICLNELEKTGLQAVIEKYRWLIDFIDYELGLSNLREFRAFKSW
jgi:hypothetical protein